MAMIPNPWVPGLPRDAVRTLDAETPEALTLTDAKRWAYQNLGQDLLASPPVAAHELDLCDLGDPPPVEPDFGALPLSSYEAKALVRHNRVMQAIDKEVLDSEVTVPRDPFSPLRTMLIPPRKVFSWLSISAIG